MYDGKNRHGKLFGFHQEAIEIQVQVQEHKHTLVKRRRLHCEQQIFTKVCGFTNSVVGNVVKCIY